MDLLWKSVQLDRRGILQLRNILYLQRKLNESVDNVCILREIIQTRWMEWDKEFYIDKIYFWHMMRHGPSNESVVEPYADDAFLSDEVTDKINRSNRSKRKKGRCIVCCSNDDEKLYWRTLDETACVLSSEATTPWNLVEFSNVISLWHLETRLELMVSCIMPVECSPFFTQYWGLKWFFFSFLLFDRIKGLICWKWRFCKHHISVCRHF